MTEMTDNTAQIDPIGPHLPDLPMRHTIDPLAFVLAFVGAPLVPATLLFWLLIPPFAVLFGGPVWIVLGLPVLLWQMPKTGPDAGKIAPLAFVGNLLATGAIYGYAVLTHNHDAEAFLWIYGIFGSVMAPAWGACFAWLYRAFLPRSRRDLLRAQSARSRAQSPAQPGPDVWSQSLATP